MLTVWGVDYHLGSLTVWVGGIDASLGGANVCGGASMAVGGKM